MGEVKFNGPSDLARLLATNWEMKTGDPYDRGYLDKFLTANRAALPEKFDRDRDVTLVEDCPEKTANITFELDPKGPRTYMPPYKPCEKPKDKEKDAKSAGL